MKNITLSLDEKTLQAGRRYAQSHNMSLNALIRRLLAQTVTNQSQNWLDDCFDLMDKQQANSGGRGWKREEIYDV